MTINELQVGGSPVNILLTSAVPKLSATRLSGAGLSTAVAGQPAVVYVRFTDLYENDAIPGDEYVIHAHTLTHTHAHARTRTHAHAHAHAHTCACPCTCMHAYRYVVHAALSIEHCTCMRTGTLSTQPSRQSTAHACVQVRCPRSPLDRALQAR